ncbi:MAG: bifunctional serine/threonine-protein kinase/formylglycine-generating enzyme family protein [Myxococcota bacterium]|jgi:serine/threonine protein kinase|nr:bifunctional serine/threonine-protein kinase/formylglycine-generating enzyme family protein [Myxococcota bacterium]
MPVSKASQSPEHGHELYRGESMFAPSRDLPSAGSVIGGRYQIQDVLGRGGFGIVYRATQLNTGQTVAVKLLKTDAFQDPAEAAIERQRFEREMHTIARLNHPNIVRLVDGGITEDGRLYTVLEYVQGETLSAVLQREGCLSPTEAKYVMMQVLDALACAHAQGIIHRDLKPQNIMLTSTGARRNAQVLDFGIATLLHERQGADYVALTGDGKINGTPAYMAPEQFGPSAPTQQVDIYAWGLVFLECLSGMQAIQGESLGEFVMRQISPEPVEIPVQYQRHPVGQIIARSIAKRTEERFGTVQELLYALDHCPVDDLPMARPLIDGGLRAPTTRGNFSLTPSTGRSSASLANVGLMLGPPPKRKRQGLLIALAILCFIVASFAVFLWVAHPVLKRGEAPDEGPYDDPAGQQAVPKEDDKTSPSATLNAPDQTELSEDSSAAPTPLSFEVEDPDELRLDTLRVAAMQTQIGLSKEELAQLSQQYPDSIFDLSYETGVSAARSYALPALEVMRRELSAAEWLDAIELGQFDPSGICPDELPTPTRSDEPLTRVGAAEARAFCEVMGMRLPTADEWEAMGRGTELRFFSFPGELDAQRQSELRASARASDAWNRTPEGLVSLSGGVREWVSCESGAYCSDGFALRGGSYLSTNAFWWLLALTGLPPKESSLCHRAVDVGFRCVKLGEQAKRPMDKKSVEAQP